MILWVGIKMNALMMSLILGMSLFSQKSYSQHTGSGPAKPDMIPVFRELHEKYKTECKSGPLKNLFVYSLNFPRSAINSPVYCPEIRTPACDKIMYRLYKDIPEDEFLNYMIKEEDMREENALILRGLLFEKLPKEMREKILKEKIESQKP